MIVAGVGPSRTCIESQWTHPSRASRRLGAVVAGSETKRAPEVAGEVGMVGVTEISSDCRKGNVGSLAHLASSVLQSATSDDRGRRQTDVPVCHALQRAQRHRKPHGRLGGSIRAALADKHFQHRVRAPSIGRDIARAGAEPPCERVDGLLMSLPCTTHHRDNLRVKSGRVHRLLGIDKRTRIHGQRTHDSGSQKRTHCPAATAQHPFGHPRRCTHERYPVRLDDEVQRGIADDRLARNDARFEVPLRNPKPLNQLRHRLRGRESVECRQLRRKQHSSRPVEHSSKVDDRTECGEAPVFDRAYECRAGRARPFGRDARDGQADG